MAAHDYGEGVVAMPGMVRPVTDERDALLSYLEQQRCVLRIAAFGLTDDEARTASTISALTVGGLVKHVTAVERTWIDMVLGRSRGGTSESYEDNFRMTEDETLDQVLQAYSTAAKETEVAIAKLDLDHPVPVPQGVPW